MRLAAINYMPPIHYAAVHTGLGETDQAFECLQRTARERNWHIAGDLTKFLRTRT